MGQGRVRDRRRVDPPSVDKDIMWHRGWSAADANQDKDSALPERHGARPGQSYNSQIRLYSREEATEFLLNAYSRE